MWPKVNKGLLPIKGHYFLYNAGIAPVQPFMPTYARDLGFSKVVVGVIYSVLPVTGMLAKPFFGAIADRFRLHKFIFLFFQIVTIIAFFSIQFIPEIPVENKEVNLVCGSQTNFHIDISDVNDECKVERVIAAADSNDVVQCWLMCELIPAWQNEICYHWKRRIPFCSNTSVLNNGKNLLTEPGTVSSKKLKSLSIGKDAYTEKFTALSVSDPLLGLNASVPMEHTVQVGKKLFFRVSTVILENDTVKDIPYCVQEVDTNCSISCESSPLAELLEVKEQITTSSVVGLYQFWLLLLFLVASWVGMAVVGSVSDAICFEILGSKANLYGNQRLWGSVGWGVFAFLTGLIMDEFSKGQSKNNYTPLFYIMLLMLLCDVACMYSLKYQQTKLSTQILKNVGKLLKNEKVVVFLIWCIFIGICIGIQWNFLFWYVDDMASGGSCEPYEWKKTLLGLLSGIQCFLGELPSFFFSGWLLKKFGHINVMSGILLFVGIRFILYSILTNPWWCLPIEILQATVGLSFATMASYASIVAPPGAEATVQGLVGATFEGIGVSLGSFLGGYFFEKFGGATAFRILGLTALAVFVLHVATQYLIGKSSSFKLDGKGNENIRRDEESVDASDELGRDEEEERDRTASED